MAAGTASRIYAQAVANTPILKELFNAEIQNLIDKHNELYVDWNADFTVLRSFVQEVGGQDYLLVNGLNIGLIDNEIYTSDGGGTHEVTNLLKLNEGGYVTHQGNHAPIIQTLICRNGDPTEYYPSTHPTTVFFTTSGSDLTGTYTYYLDGTTTVPELSGSATPGGIPIGTPLMFVNATGQGSTGSVVIRDPSTASVVEIEDGQAAIVIALAGDKFQGHVLS